MSIDELAGNFIKYDDLLGELEGYEYEYDDVEDRVAVLKEKQLKQKNMLRSLDAALDTSTCITETKSDYLELLSAVKTVTSEQKTSYESMLPKIHIKNFSGDYRDWPMFNDHFNKMHTDKRLSGIQRLTYLLSLLQQEPLGASSALNGCNPAQHTAVTQRSVAAG